MGYILFIHIALGKTCQASHVTNMKLLFKAASPRENCKTRQELVDAKTVGRMNYASVVTLIDEIDNDGNGKSGKKT